MGLQVPQKKRNTGLLPCFENRLATSGFENKDRIDQRAVKALFKEHHKQVQRLIDQSKAIPPAQFTQEMADLLNELLQVDYVWISDINLKTGTMENVKGMGKVIGHFHGKILVQPTSPFWALSGADCVAEPSNALLKYSNCPYLQKFNINAFVIHSIEVKDIPRGLIAVMSNTSINHPQEVCELIGMVAHFLAGFLYSSK